ncbi:MAG TPA: 4a-hydroxytetrahydrobiopterin dehydratase [Candidatus Brocadiaceae bacterium]
MSLSSLKCVACRGDEPRLKREEINKYLKEIHEDWKLENHPAVGQDKITREFDFKNFLEAISFVNKVSKIAEEERHHPNIYLHDYKKVKLELYTHKIGGLHKNDFILASKIDNL